MTENTFRIPKSGDPQQQLPDVLKRVVEFIESDAETSLTLEKMSSSSPIPKQPTTKPSPLSCEELTELIDLHLELKHL